MDNFEMNDFQWLEYFPGYINYSPEVTINANHIQFNAATLKKLGLPVFVKISFDPSGRRVALQGFSEKDSKTIDLNPGRKGKPFSIHKNDKVRFIRSLMPEWDETTRFKIPGEYHEKDNIMVFDLKKAVVWEGGTFPVFNKK